MVSMVTHVLNILELALGTILIFFAAVVWSMFRKFSSAALALSALFVYITIAIDLLSFYRIIDPSRILIFRGVPLLSYVPTFLMLLSLIFTIYLFYKEERNM
jgi:hypothetical protein